jgi:hypothetical protein
VCGIFQVSQKNLYQKGQSENLKSNSGRKPHDENKKRISKNKQGEQSVDWMHLAQDTD